MKTWRKDQVVENFFGVEVADPYRWLEDEELDETKEWTDFQNEKTTRFLEKTGHYEDTKKSLTDLYNYAKYSTPQKKGDYYYFYKNEGLQKQPILYRSKKLKDQDLEIVIDPLEFAEDGTAAITQIAFDGDGEKLAYAISYNGSDWQEVKIKNLVTKTDYPEVLKGCKFVGIAWDSSSKGFYYNCYPFEDEELHLNQGYDNAVYWHEVGKKQNQDSLIYKDKRREYAFYPTLSHDKKTLLLSGNNGTEPKNEILFKDLSKETDFQNLITGIDAQFYYLGNDGDNYYFETDYEATNSKLICINLKNTNKDLWKVVVAESDEPIQFSKYVNKKFIVCRMKDVMSKVEVYSNEGLFLEQIKLPEFITVMDIQNDKSSSDIYIHYTSFLIPQRILKYNIDSKEYTTIFQSDISEKLKDIVVKQVWYEGNDQTKIPMFVVYNKHLDLNGENHTLLYGYGGYGISMMPTFNPANALWVLSGGVYAVANIRGGGEFGKEWHKSAILENKQVTIDDFICAAEWLIEENYTSKSKLAIMGGSNGGMLVGACVTQRPDLFGGVLCLVPVTDMLRFQKFTVGRFWVTEFGCAENSEEEFKNLYSYSPLHNVRKGVEYPPILITTADSDDRVVPLHAKKFAATLQEKNEGNNPVLLRVEKNAGHGLGKPVSKLIDYNNDLFTFLFEVLQVSRKG